MTGAGDDVVGVPLVTVVAGLRDASVVGGWTAGCVVLGRFVDTVAVPAGLVVRFVDVFLFDVFLFDVDFLVDVIVLVEVVFSGPFSVVGVGRAGVTGATLFVAGVAATLAGVAPATLGAVSAVVVSTVTASAQRSTAG